MTLAELEAKLAVLCKRRDQLAEHRNSVLAQIQTLQADATAATHKGRKDFIRQQIITLQDSSARLRDQIKPLNREISVTEDNLKSARLREGGDPGMLLALAYGTLMRMAKEGVIFRLQDAATLATIHTLLHPDEPQPVVACGPKLVVPAALQGPPQPTQPCDTPKPGGVTPPPPPSESYEEPDWFEEADAPPAAPWRPDIDQDCWEEEAQPDNLDHTRPMWVPPPAPKVNYRR